MNGEISCKFDEDPTSLSQQKLHDGGWWMVVVVGGWWLILKIAKIRSTICANPTLKAHFAKFGVFAVLCLNSDSMMRLVIWWGIERI